MYNHTVSYGSSADPANYNNSEFINITRSGYTAVSGAEWICLSGCTTANKTFNHSTSYASTDYCAVGSGNCTVELGVNWVDNIAPTATLAASASGTSVTATLSSVVEAGSGISSYYYAIVASTASCSGYTASSNKTYTWTGKGIGTYKVCAKLTDKAGNSKEYTKTVTVSKCYRALQALSCNDQPMSVSDGATNVGVAGSSYYITVTNSAVTNGETWYYATEKYNPFTYATASLNCWVVATSTSVSEYTDLGGACY